jgi:cysteinyl-tRNA synthetase
VTPGGEQPARRRRALLAALAALVLLAGLAVWGLTTRDDDNAEPPTAVGSPSAGPAPTANAATPSATPGKPSRSPSASASPSAAPGRISSWAYQLQGYAGGRLDSVARGPYQLAVVDLARDAHADYFTAGEIRAVRRTGKRVLAYFEIGSIEEFRPEYPGIRRDAVDLIANEWADWPGEHFVRYWDARRWDRVVKPRLDQALRAGFDGVYLDTPLAYEEIDLSAAQGRDRDALGQEMTDLIVKISAYAKARHPGFLIVPQNSPELRQHHGYTEAVDGIAMEELFYLATDKPCAEDWCAENLDETRKLRDAGKFVLSVDYATRADDVRAACGRYRAERFAGTVTVRELDRLTAPCG